MWHPPATTVSNNDRDAYLGRRPQMRYRLPLRRAIVTRLWRLLSETPPRRDNLLTHAASPRVSSQGMDDDQVGNVTYPLREFDQR